MLDFRQVFLKGFDLKIIFKELVQTIDEYFLLWNIFTYILDVFDRGSKFSLNNFRLVSFH